MVVEDFSSEMEGFLAVKKGQLVEVLNQGSSAWLVVTVTSTPGELEDEGFLPAHCLQPASKCESASGCTVISAPLLRMFCHIQMYMYFICMCNRFLC